MAIQEDAFRYAIKNAFLHEGKADISAVVGKVIALHKGTNMKELMPLVIAEVKKVNALSLDEIHSQYNTLESSYELKKPEKKSGLPELAWAEKEPVITRYAPNPNGPFHLGNARAAFLSWEYAQKYTGTFLLRFEDTDPKIKKSMTDAENIFLHDLEWLGITPDKVFFQSDNLERYYEIIRELIQKGHAYVCTCEPTAWRDLIKESNACSCRSSPPDKVDALFQDMLSHKLKQGQAVVRLKTELNHPDPSIRDYWLARIIDEPNHPRKGAQYFVWPGYNLASAVDDHDMGITLILRGQEHEQNMQKQRFMYAYLGWTYPHAIHFGRIKLGKLILSTSKILAGILAGDYTGWDDPRLGTIRALRRRGFVAESLKQALLDVGTKSNDASIDLKKLIDLNTKAIDDHADRAMFIADPIRLDVSFAPIKTVTFPVHPEHPERGKRSYNLLEGTQSFSVAQEIIKQLKIGDIVRLRNAYNIRISRIDELQVFAEFVGGEVIKKNTLFWLTDSGDASLLLENSKEQHGIIDPYIGKKKSGDMIQLEGQGYARIDSIDKRIHLRFTHD